MPICRRSLLAACAALLAGAPRPPSAERLIAEHNAERQKAGVGKLERNEALMEYAQKHAANMATTGRLRHSAMSDMSALGFSVVGENIAAGQDDELDVISAWMRSTGHRRNILREGFDAIGVGIAEKNGRIWWCVCFGKAKPT